MAPLSTALRYCWHRPNCSIDTAAPMNPDRQPAAASQSTAIPATSATTRQVAALLPDQLAHQRHRRGLGRHVLQRDDVAVVDQRGRLGQRDHFVDSHAGSLQTMEMISRPPCNSITCPVR